LNVGARRRDGTFIKNVVDRERRPAEVGCLLVERGVNLSRRPRVDRTEERVGMNDAYAERLAGGRWKWRRFSVMIASASLDATAAASKCRSEGSLVMAFCAACRQRDDAPCASAGVRAIVRV
jgi:hypothetical protein